METNKNNKFLIKSKKQMFTVIAVFTLMLFVGGTTYAFFNYTRTGAANTVRTGTINFSSSETGNTVTLSNVFPVSASTIGTANESANDVRTVEVTIEGNTTYNGGIEYVLTLDDVNIETNTTPKKEIPLSLNVSVEGLDSKTIGTPSDDYFTARGNNTTPSTTALYQILAKETVKQDEQILVGYIPKDVDVKGKVIVKAYIDASKVLITDTPVGNDSQTDGYINGTDTTGKTIITTTEWNSLNSTPLSFKVKVEANDGIWLEESEEITTIESCPDCQFIFTTNSYNYGTNGTEVENITETISNNYNDVITNERKYFIGFTETQNGKIDRAYACGIKEEEPNQGTVFCIEGTTDGSKYTANTTFLNDEGLWNDTCVNQYDPSGARVDCPGLVWAYTHSNGNVSTGNQYSVFRCAVGSSGTFSCD